MNSSVGDSASNSSKLTELAADPITARNRVTADVVVDENGLQEVVAEVFTTDKIPFSFPNLSDTGDKNLNLLVSVTGIRYDRNKIQSHACTNHSI